MRKGLNPNKDRLNQELYSHQVVIPVFIPNLDGYFKDSLEILKICIASLFKTAHPKTYISIVNNGSGKEVTDYLDSLFNEGKVHELVNSANIGKLNSIIKGLVGNNIPFITIADCDVLFLSGWQKETMKIFENFPKTGVVGLSPQFKSYESFCGNVIFETLFSSSVKYRSVKNPKALERYYESLGWDKSYNKDYLKRHLTIEKSGFSAVVGSGHYAATYRRQIFEDSPLYFSAKMGRDSERIMDILPLRKGFWRLTTEDNYAYHMGNVKEDWMEPELNNCQLEFDNLYQLDKSYQFKKEHSVSFFLKNHLFTKIFSSYFLKNLFYSLKGLPGEMRKRY